MEYPIYRFDEIDSTNDFAKEKISAGESLPFLVISKKQTKGRGRRGRNFFSPEGGFYFTYAFEAKDGLKKYYEEIPVTIIAALAAVQAIERASGISTKVKWINDILLNEKKVGGILTEGIPGNHDAIVIGIGLNLASQEFPEEIREIADCLCWEGDRDALMEELAGRIGCLLTEAETPEGRKEILDSYKERCSTFGRRVSFRIEGEELEGLAMDLDEKGQLIVELDGGRRMAIFGEISLKANQ